MATKHETTAPKQAATHHEPPTPAADAEPTESKVLMEGTGGIKYVRFTLNGLVKSLHVPISGAELYRIAGNPAKLTVGGRAVANTTEPLDLADDAEVTATY